MIYPKVKKIVKITAVALALSSAAAYATECVPSKFGPNDQIGNMNYVTAEKTLAASKLVKTGKTYRLGIETNRSTPAFAPRNFAVTIVQPGQVGGVTIGGTKLTYNDDIVMGWNGVGSQIDGLGHIGMDNLYYNCNKAADFVAITGMSKLGIETVPGFATRGIVLDIAGLKGVDYLTEGTPINKPEILEAMKRQGIKSIEKGDIVILHTGWLKLLGKDDKRFGSVEPGLGLEGARYLASLGVAAVGADTWGVETVPFEKGAGVFEVHQILLMQNGIYILENMNTEELVKDKAWEFFFTLGPARMTGAVQAIINPIAIR